LVIVVGAGHARDESNGAESLALQIKQGGRGFIVPTD